VTICTQYSFEFQPVKRGKIKAEFSDGDITSNGGVLLLREMDRHLGVLHDPRQSFVPRNKNPLGDGGWGVWRQAVIYSERSFTASSK
jgi:hypothetical protein